MAKKTNERIAKMMKSYQFIYERHPEAFIRYAEAEIEALTAFLKQKKGATPSTENSPTDDKTPVKSSVSHESIGTEDESITLISVPESLIRSLSASLEESLSDRLTTYNDDDNIYPVARLLYSVIEDPGKLTKRELIQMIDAVGEELFISDGNFVGKIKESIRLFNQIFPDYQITE